MAGTRPGTPSRQKGLLQLKKWLMGWRARLRIQIFEIFGWVNNSRVRENRDEECGYTDFVSRRNGRNGAARFAAPPVPVTFAVELSQDELD